MKLMTRISYLLAVFLLSLSPVFAQQPPPSGLTTSMPTITTIPPDARSSSNFNVEKAAAAYMALIPSNSKSRSDAYFEGGYWLILWDFLYGVGVSILLLNLRWSA